MDKLLWGSGLLSVHTLSLLGLVAGDDKKEGDGREERSTLPEEKLQTDELRENRKP